MNNIAFIHARGNSKRIPKKNIKLFYNKPIIAYVIESAKKSGLFEHIIVSTDSNEIADVAKKYGAEVPNLRPEHLADDFTTTIDVLLNDISQHSKFTDKAGHICCLYGTAVFTKPHHLIASHQKMIDEQANSVVPVTSFDYPIQRAFGISQKNTMFYREPQYLATRSQDLEDFYHDVGQFYWVQKSYLVEHKKIINEQTCPYVVNSSEFQDIDTPNDLLLAEIKYKALYQQDNT